MTMKLSLQIRLLRHSAKLDQHEAAAKLQISVAQYSRIETGLDKSEEEIIERLTALFGLA